MQMTAGCRFKHVRFWLTTVKSLCKVSRNGSLAANARYQEGECGLLVSDVSRQTSAMLRLVPVPGAGASKEGNASHNGLFCTTQPQLSYCAAGARTVLFLFENPKRADHLSVGPVQ